MAPQVLASASHRVSRVPLAPEQLARLNAGARERYPVLLESAAEVSPLNRYDVLFAGPAERLTLEADGRLEGPPLVTAAGKFLPALDRWWRAEREDQRVDVPFAGGWFLYLGYELAAEVEPTLELPVGSRPIAIAWRMHGAVVFDRHAGTAWLAAEAAHAERLEAELKRDLEMLGSDRTHSESQGAVIELPLDEEPPERYLAGVESALEAIARGDVYQANLSRRWRARLARGVDASTVYRRLRRANPAPFAGIAHLPGFSVLSSSPERLMRIENGSASTRPIAGTRPRGQTRTSDESLRTELRLNEKEQAEHVMLVDLERNDLGRICRAGTVRVDEYMTIESYAHVHHIVSNVRGELRDDVTPGQAIAAVFPGGTITGCPKIRCIQLLAELEREPREAYTGSMGYLRLDGDLDLNILIRTIMVMGNALEFRTGAGIVADSRPTAELEETRAKARGLLRALGAPG